MPNLTVLVDNEVSNSTLGRQHGLSIWIETGSSNVLFDTGQDELFLKNADILGVPITDTTHLVLSHGHYDHTGGVPDMLDIGTCPQVIVGPEAWVQRQSSHPIGIPWPQDILPHQSLSINHDIFHIEPSVAVINIGGTSDPESRHPGLQRLVNGQWEPDPFPDEQIIVMQTIKGLVVITGCTHCGLSALISRVKNVSGGRNIHALIGGLHLVSSTREDILESAQLLQDIDCIWVNHCTGSEAFALLRDTLGPKIEWAGAGFHTELPPLI